MRHAPFPGPRPSPWAILVAACALLVVGGFAAVAVGNLASRSERIATYVVRGSLSEVVLDLGDGDVVVARGKPGASVAVRRVERYSYDRRPTTERSVEGGVFRASSRCPSTILDDCSVSYRVLVPDNVSVDITTGGGGVRLEDYRGSGSIATDGGDVTVTGYCGFSLEVSTNGGSVAASADCPPSRLRLRTGSGAIRATVPPGSYVLEAESSTGAETVRGLTSVVDAPFSVQALSRSGSVVVEAAP